MTNINNFNVIQKLGEGAFSQVFRVRRISDGKEYAMKKVKMMKLSEREKQNALNEVRILASIQHPNIIAYKEAFFEDATSSLCIIMEYADGGDLMKLISSHKRKATHFTEKEIWYYFIQIVRGIKTLHDLKICHRDIKCANIFLTKDGVIKLGDLNVSKVAKKGMLHTQTGTPYYASPEVWKDKPYDNRSDIWSLGCVLYEMVTLNPPFRAPNMNGLYHKVLRGVYDPIPSQYSIDLQMMIRACLQVSQISRPSCNKILQMPGLLNHLSGTLEALDIKVDLSHEDLLCTIKVPKVLGQITERLPKPQYQLKRVNSEPPERVSGLPEIKSKDNLISVAHSIFDNKAKLPGGLAQKVLEERKRVGLDVIQEDVPASREIDREPNPRSAEPNLQKNKAKNYHSVEPQNLHETRTPHYMNNKAKLLIKHQENEQLRLPKIQATKQTDVTGIGKLPRVGRNQENVNPNPIYMNRGDAYAKYQADQKKIMHHVYGAGKLPSHRRDGRSADVKDNSKRVKPNRIY